MSDLQLPPQLNRRFEAIVLDWHGTAVADEHSDARRVRSLVETLCTAGMHVAVVSGTSMEEVDSQLQARPSGPGRLFLCVSGGSEVFLVGSNGVQLMYRRVASRTEDRLLAAAAMLTAKRVVKGGLRAKISSPGRNRRVVDLIPLHELPASSKARGTGLAKAVRRRHRKLGAASRYGALEIALAAAGEVGLSHPRVTVDAEHIEIGLTDKSDSARWILNELWSCGVGPGLVLIVGDEFGAPGGLPGSDSMMLVTQAARSTAVSVGLEPTGVPPGVTWLSRGPDALLRLLEDQVRRRRERSLPEIDLDPAWIYRVGGFDHESERVQESLLSLGDGRFGTAGAPLDSRPGALPRVLAAGVYSGQGAATELLTCPLWDRSGLELSEALEICRTLDMRTGILLEEAATRSATRRAFRFSSLSRPGTMVLRAEGSLNLVPSSRPLLAPEEWRHPQEGGTASRRWMKVGADAGGVTAAASEIRALDASVGRLERLAVYVSDPQNCPPASAAVGSLAAAEAEGFDQLLAAHRAAWAQRWTDADIRIEGDAELELAIRFALFHLIGSVASTGEAAVGARGLSGTAYRGHVFWDSDVFVLPFLAATHPAAARAMLEYRVRRLPAARASAKAMGRNGARFPWESALTGSDVTPPLMRSPSGKDIEVRTGLLEEHIVADVAWAAQTYVDWSSDMSFASGPGRTLILETARYWASRICLGEDGRAHIYGVIGPDEYHEDVDDNAFTNVMARWNLRRAASLAGVGADERARWRELARLLVDGYDRTSGLYEQFTGFWKLEPLIIKDMAPRRPVAADLLLGAERVRQAQVIKQPDVLMLHHMVPDSVARRSLAANLDFYEPRTAHGSSLSPGVHAALLARAGRVKEALETLRMTARLDLDDLTRTSAGGLHLAAMGGLWQALVYGFAGVRPSATILSLDPHLPVSWHALEIPLLYHGNRLRLRIEPETVTLQAERPLTVRFSGGMPTRVAAGVSSYRREGRGWKELRS
ncbi:MAG: glycosyl hydrolase family 65 protein [Isosphaeraceae bacterium]